LLNISQRIRNVLQVTRRRCYNVLGTSGKLLEEEFTTYQEHVASYLNVMLWPNTKRAQRPQRGHRRSSVRVVNLNKLNEQILSKNYREFV
jgi:hypothetical protein